MGESGTSRLTRRARGWVSSDAVVAVFFYDLLVVCDGECAGIFDEGCVAVDVAYVAASGDVVEGDVARVWDACFGG